MGPSRGTVKLHRRFVDSSSDSHSVITADWTPPTWSPSPMKMKIRPMAMVTRPVYRRTSQLHRATFLLFGPFYAMFHVEMLCLTINIFVQQIADIYPFTLLQFELFQYFSHFHMNLNTVETFIS